MTQFTPKRKRLVFAVLIASSVSLLPIVLPFFTFLWLPGTAVGLLLFGTRTLFTSFGLLRAVVSAVLWSVLLYFGADLWNWGQTHPTRQGPDTSLYSGHCC
jgi:hypothetical protein